MDEEKAKKKHSEKESTVEFVVEGEEPGESSGAEEGSELEFEIPEGLPEEKPEVPTTPEMEKIEKQAEDLLDAGEFFEYMFRRAGVCIMFKRSDEETLHTAYICSQCGFSEAKDQEPVKPYKLTCSSCGHEVFKQEKVKGKKKGRKKKKKA